MNRNNLAIPFTRYTFYFDCRSLTIEFDKSTNSRGVRYKVDPSIATVVLFIYKITESSRFRECRASSSFFHIGGITYSFFFILFTACKWRTNRYSDKAMGFKRHTRVASRLRLVRSCSDSLGERNTRIELASEIQRGAIIQEQINDMLCLTHRSIPCIPLSIRIYL